MKIWVLPSRFEQHVGETVMWSRGRFSRFFRVCLQSFQKVLIWFKTKCNMGIKNANFDADFESVKKAAKNLIRKKLSTKKWKNWIFDFYYCVQNLPTYNFFGKIFYALFSRVAFNDTQIEFLNYIFFAYISTFCLLQS